MSSTPRGTAHRHAFRSPTGTRDFYPAETLRRRYIEKLWRDTSVRHGFEEIDGPTFEHTGLYTVKSGEGIVSEMFGVYSGKDEAAVKAMGERLARGETAPAPYALRPEFTPTLARMYAARAAQLPRPTRWFWINSCFRGERPQRGRLREFLQWNCDVVGGDDEGACDEDIVSCVSDALDLAGLAKDDASIRACDRRIVARVLTGGGVAPNRVESAFALLDRAGRTDPGALAQGLVALGARPEFASALCELLRRPFEPVSYAERLGADFTDAPPLPRGERVVFDLSIVRGLAYYTGMVFEVIAHGERAIAGGGRYDNLIELFGGPPTPAVGFGMGDVVLSLVLQDRGLMPEGRDLLDALSRPGASLRPDVFVISNGAPDADAVLRPTVARLRRGIESPAWREKPGRKPWDADRCAPPGGAPPLHSRHSYKASRNIGKLLSEAAGVHARFAAILESADEATLKNLGTGEQLPARVRVEHLGVELAKLLGLAGA